MENTAENAVQTMSRFVNNFSDRAPEFAELMQREHRTLQQSFTKLVLKWIETVASDTYRHDPRNEASHKVCKEMLEAFRKAQSEKGFTDGTLDLMSKPSGYLPMI